jgi:outer membrane protein TolC
MTTLEANINKELANINQNYQTHTLKLQNSQTTVEAANRAYQLAQTRYKEGLITNTELILIQIEVEEANLNALQVRYQLLVDKLQSHEIVGTKLYQ